MLYSVSEEPCALSRRLAQDRAASIGPASLGHRTEMVQKRPVQACFRRSDSANPTPLMEPSTTVSVVTGSRFIKSWQSAPETKQIPRRGGQGHPRYRTVCRP